jgi:hypothetical protein
MKSGGFSSAKAGGATPPTINANASSSGERNFMVRSLKKVKGFGDGRETRRFSGLG